MKRNAATRRRDKEVEAAYREWIAPAAYCVVCGDVNCELAHIRGPAQGYMKPPPWHTLPLCRSCHTAQETNRDFFPGGWRWAQEAAKTLFLTWEIQNDLGQWARELDNIHRAIAMRAA